MARKKITLDIQDRDQLLRFTVQEMPATRLESWLLRAASLLDNCSGQTPTGATVNTTISLLLKNGLPALAALDFEKARPLLDELLSCCARVVENVEERCTPESVDAYIHDAKTLFTLRMEAIKLNLGFSGPEGAKLSGYPAHTSTVMQ